MNSLSFSPKLANLKVVLALPSLQSVLEVGFMRKTQLTAK